MNNVSEAKRIVVKVGTSTLTHETGKLNLRRMEELAKVIADLVNSGKEIILVSSGAITAGTAKIGLGHRAETTEEKQATAAVGQNELMRVYDRFFSMYGHTVGQILLTKEVIENEHSRENAENTFRTLLKMKCIPIVNENDTISFYEIKFGDNDTLAAYVAKLCGADLLINMSDIDGLYTGDPRNDPNAVLIPTVERVDEHIMSYASGAGTNRGTGGVITKLNAAVIATEAGIPMFLVNGEEPSILYDVCSGKKVGTHFLAR